ncbi:MULTISPECIES: SDR family oxidoreductase [Asticcacaulis]|uniref:SDR family oxidoreductase n=1 Tax=Asticcacaulis TaxID=76890 RepID=UPI001AE39471|nr:MULTISPECIES: SDR family oxidoreductase [Asticcacaulis]MBP2159630.1 short-subunit dehydrogenase [Asticcacaulis solisilvae]MDR6800543.1 short-subunit dehydrogenase [Asticcacaulis sp. BE141]
MTHKDLSHSTIVITGASSGIGEATAEAFALHGARLVLAARDVKAVKAVAAHCRALGARVKPVYVDVTDPQSVRRLASKAVGFGGGIDVWVSNVGVGAFGRFEDTPIEAHEQVLRANLFGHMADAHAVVPIFKAQKHGTFINIISLGGYTGTPFSAAYSASKFGLRGFSEALRGELAGHRDIHICDVYPAFIDTPGLSHAANYTGRELKAPPPVFDPRRVADAVVALARRPRDTTTVGWTAPAAKIAHGLAPGLFVSVMAGLIDRYLRKAKPVPVTDGNLYHAPAVPGGIDHKHRRNPVRYETAPKASLPGGVALLAGVAIAGIALVWPAMVRAEAKATVPAE